MAETWLWKPAQQCTAAGTDTFASTSGLAEDPSGGIHEATNSEYMRHLCQALSCSLPAGAGLPGTDISGTCCQAVLWQRLLQALRPGNHDRGACVGLCEASLSACSVMPLLGQLLDAT